MKSKTLFFLFGTILLLTGCVYGQCINGPCALEHSRIVADIKPNGAHWVKEGATSKSRMSDSWACGAAATVPGANGPIFSDEKINRERKNFDKNDYGPRDRLFDQWGACMKSKGYTYIEQCDSRCMYP
ncbi:hypothetical protein [Amphibiibacter pelophylacis]|uniref:Uncharacterized protein n=1 Tax=Amphibiibacter pelophylacis TaxID=1799477 RepID=A0ACC6P4Q6_9BURK